MYKFQGLTLTVGCPGAGKSTWADKNIPTNTLRLERDRMRECLFGERKAYWQHPLPANMKSFMVTDMMMNAIKVWPVSAWAITDTGLLAGAYRPFINYAKALQLPIRVIVFDRSEEYLRDIDAIRPADHRVGDKILNSMLESYNDPDAWWKQPSDDFNVFSVEQCS